MKLEDYSQENLKQLFGDFDPQEVIKNDKVTIDWYKWRGIDLTYYGNWQRDYAKLLIEIADLESDITKDWVTILDVGCSTGLNMRGIDELNIFKNIYGVDTNCYIINELINEVHKYYNWNAKTNWFCTPSYDLSMIDDNNVDLIICSHCIEHLENKYDVEQTMYEFKRVLHPDGKIIMNLPTITKEESKKKNFLDRVDASPFHHLAKTSTWWNGIFKKYFKSESLKARYIFKNSKLKPDRENDKTFYESYGINNAWTIYRLIHK